LLVNPKTVPVNTVEELTQFIKARPGQLAYASGNASGHVAAEWYKQIAGFDAVHVPYKGVPQAINDMIGGNIHFMFADATLGIPTAKSGKLRALAVTNSVRVQSIPEVISPVGLACFFQPRFPWRSLKNLPKTAMRS
jgi:tripartite-type tricarboxylate transporter receptor subunit TctC